MVKVDVFRQHDPHGNFVDLQHLGDMALGAYATPGYIADHGGIERPADLKRHRLIGYDRSTLIIDGFAELGIRMQREDFAFRSDDQVVCWQMVRAGFGVGFNQIAIGDADPAVMRVSGPEHVGAIPVWLTAHPDMHAVPRVRKIYDRLWDILRAIISTQKRRIQEDPPKDPRLKGGDARSS